ncbi:hypothetical protein EHQ27_04605 [Leptospira wolffii]|uniref:hypothetical protein n=1 Tax=Leptospira wolffii TaxID=409998 RepID=UPI0010832A6E|nr:hypothetical protein [Leptospira wolffii]TGK58145.1 hypothetical protein EHQ32_12665 [Leptospira wolffii]TGK68824.1 hypothetical protein EHQ35_18535 [Leptospira wolffii]TGK76336.1 hypothetical protein EHQ27_04605 [Leptospira wolffii]TGL27176.1 hypothetical protein EHQ57_16515 [Leptospira wolffii]
MKSWIFKVGRLPYLVGFLALLIAVVVIYYRKFYFSKRPFFADRFEYRGLTRADAESRGISGLPNGISSYYLKRCSFRNSWIVYSKYSLKNDSQRAELIRRFRKNPGLNVRFDSYPEDWPQDFDRDSCKPDWWSSCPKGEWAEIRKDPPLKNQKDGFYLCESDPELRWFVFHFREIE